ncbi:hypothetical protein D3C79_831500 [compost metagenome]
MAGPGVLQILRGDAGEALLQTLQVCTLAYGQATVVDVVLTVFHGVANQQAAPRQQAQGAAARQGRQHAPALFVEQLLPVRPGQRAGDACAQLKRERAAALEPDPGQERTDTGQYLPGLDLASLGAGSPALARATAQVGHSALLEYVHLFWQAVSQPFDVARRLHQAVAARTMDRA